MPNDVVINIRAKGTRQAAADVGSVSRSLSLLSKHASGKRLIGGGGPLGGALGLLAPAAALGALGEEVKKSSDAWQEQRIAGLQTAAVLKSTGGVAGVTAGRVNELADSLSRKSGIDRVQIQAGENMLLTFRNIRNEAGAGNNVFDQSTRAALDMSAAFNAAGKSMSVAEASLQLGKALNDPLKGMARLTRIGVTFSQQQKNEVAALTAVGDRMGAQKVILRELNREFGGSALADATPINRMKVAVHELQVGIGRGLSPIVDAAATGVEHLAIRAAPKLEHLQHQLDGVFKRKDLTFSQKLDLAGTDIQKTMRPFERELGRGIRSLHIGDDIEKGFEYAAPRLLDAAAKAAPKAAAAFVGAWWHSGVWAKLFTVALIARRLGAFGALGELAAGQFKSGFTRLAWRSGGLTPVGGLGARGGKWGKLLGVGMAAGVALEAPQIWEQIGDTLGFGKSFHHEAARGLKGLVSPEATSSHDTINPLKHFVRDPAAPLDQSKTLSLPVGQTAVRDPRAPHGYRIVPESKTTDVIQNHIHVYLEGKKVAKVTNRVDADYKARGSKPPGGR